MVQYFSTAIVLVLFALVLAACGVRSAPTYDYAGNKAEQYRYAPVYE